MTITVLIDQLLALFINFQQVIFDILIFRTKVDFLKSFSNPATHFEENSNVL